MTDSKPLTGAWCKSPTNAATMTRVKQTFLAVLMLAIAGCAAMSPEECEFADWAALGELDARQGRAFDYLARRGKACNEAGFGTDTAAYRAGWDRGIRAYCQVDQGFADGLGGRAYHGACPLELEGDFLGGYSIGRDIYNARVARDAEDQAIRNLEVALADPKELTRDEIRDLERELDRRRLNVRALEREVGVLEGQAMALGFRP